jgi:hypothetical protein
MDFYFGLEVLNAVTIKVEERCVLEREVEILIFIAVRASLSSY